MYERRLSFPCCVLLLLKLSCCEIIDIFFSSFPKSSNMKLLPKFSYPSHIIPHPNYKNLILHFFQQSFQVIAERLSEEEIGGLKELFKMIDTDSSGTITFEELKEGLRRVGSDLMESEIKSLMDAVSK